MLSLSLSLSLSLILCCAAGVELRERPHAAWTATCCVSDPCVPGQVRNLSIPASEAFDFALFLANPSDVRDWNIQGLPADAFSTENGVMVTRSPAGLS